MTSRSKPDAWQTSREVIAKIEAMAYRAMAVGQSNLENILRSLARQVRRKEIDPATGLSRAKKFDVLDYTSD